MIVVIWIIATISVLAVSITWIIVNPVFNTLMDNLNSTMMEGLTGQPKTTFNLVQTVSRYALGFWLVISVIALVAWAYMKAQERETIYGRYA